MVGEPGRRLAAERSVRGGDCALRASFVGRGRAAFWARFAFVLSCALVRAGLLAADPGAPEEVVSVGGLRPAPNAREEAGGALSGHGRMQARADGGAGAGRRGMSSPER